MWDEEINKKIKEAADQYHPAYDEEAWGKMEKLLDKHLPQKKDWRRIIYFFPLFIIVAVVLFFMISRKESTPSSKISEKPGLKSNSEKSQDQNLSAGKVATRHSAVKPGKGAVVADVNMKNEVLNETPAKALNHTAKKIDKLAADGNITVVERKTQLTKNVRPVGQEKKGEDESLSIEANAQKRSPGEINNTNEPIVKAGNLSNNDILPPGISVNNDSLKTVSTNITIDQKETIKSTDLAKVENPKVAKSNIAQKKTRKGFIHNFGIGLSIGPDVSAAELSNTGKITLAYGAQLSYSITRKFTLRTGFYVAKKIYSVDDTEYHLPRGSTWNNFLESVDADCKVHEIPVTLSYNFGKSKNHHWFASAGLSSYFMKRESYVYYYKDPIRGNYNRPWEVSNKNKNYFSVLDISGGYEYFINQRFSISAEPYVKIPFSGIGAGKIKLNSAGILFSVGVKPF